MSAIGWLRKRRRPEAELVEAIAAVRESVVAVLRIHRVAPPPEAGRPVQGQQVQFELNIVGTAWCTVTSRFLVTAHHTLNAGQPRDPHDRFYAFSTPGNGAVAYPTPVRSFPLESPGADMAILEIAAPSPPVPPIPAAPVTFHSQRDGERVLTYGFPAPVIADANVDSNGNWLGGNLFLKAHANEGIVAGQFDIHGQLFYEFNVGWHHGESGGAIFRIDPAAAFAVMQQYRSVQTPHGIMPGPRQGRSLKVIESELRNIGAVLQK